MPDQGSIYGGASGTSGTGSGSTYSNLGGTSLGAPPFAVDVSQVKALDASLKRVAADIADITAAVKAMNGALSTGSKSMQAITGLGSRLKQAMGIGASGTAGASTNTPATFKYPVGAAQRSTTARGSSAPSQPTSAAGATTSSIGLDAATFSGPTAAGGAKAPTTISAAPVGGGSYVGRGATYLAAGEIGGQLAGQLNSFVSNNLQANNAIDIAARRQQSMFGGTRQQNVNTSMGMLPQSPADMAQALAVQAQNPMLLGGGNSSRAKNLQKNIADLIKLNPGMSTTTAMSVAGALTSNQGLYTANIRGLSKQGVLFNPTTGGINNPQTMMKSLLQMAFGPQVANATPAQMKAITPADWAGAQTNLTQAYGASAASQILPLLETYASQGGNLNNAMGVNKSSPALSTRYRAAAAAGTSTSVYQQGEASLNLLNHAAEGASKALTTMIRDIGGVGNILVGSAGLAAGIGLVISKFALLRGAFDVLKGIGGVGGGGGGGGAAASSTAAEAAGSSAGTAPGLLSRVRTPYAGSFTSGVVLGGAAITQGLIGIYTTQHGQWGDNWAWRGVTSSSSQPALDKAWTAEMQFMAPHGVGSGPAALINAGTRFLTRGKQLGISRSRLWTTMSSSGQLPAPILTDLQSIGDPVSGGTTTQGLHASLAHGINAMRAMNPNIKINSGRRSSRQQSLLYALKGGHNIARPGHSAHQTGHAADLGPPSQYGWIARNASKFGLYGPSRAEPWHMQAIGDPSPNPSVSGAQIEQAWIKAGGPKSIAPLMAQVAYQQSGDNPQSVNPNDPGPYGSVGLWQINSAAHPTMFIKGAGALKTTAANAAAAVALYKEAGLSPWSLVDTYNSAGQVTGTAENPLMVAWTKAGNKLPSGASLGSFNGSNGGSGSGGGTTSNVTGLPGGGGGKSTGHNVTGLGMAGAGGFGTSLQSTFLSQVAGLGGWATSLTGNATGSGPATSSVRWAEELLSVALKRPQSTISQLLSDVGTVSTQHGDPVNQSIFTPPPNVAQSFSGARGGTVFQNARFNITVHVGLVGKTTQEDANVFADQVFKAIQDQANIDAVSGVK